MTHARTVLMQRLLGVTGLSLLATGALAAAPPGSGPAAQAPVAITNVRIFDGDKVMGMGTVVFAGGKIVAAGDKVAVPRGAKVIDGKGDTLMPGLIDTHVHFVNRVMTVGALALEQAAAYGVTSVRDMSGADADGLAFRGKLRAGEFPQAADLFLGGGSQGVRTPEAAPAAVARAKALGADHIGEIGYDTNQQHFGWRDPVTDDTLKAMVDAAHAQGEIAVVHTLQAVRAKLAVLDGADGLVHISPYDPPDDDFGRMVAAHHAWQSTNVNSYAPPSYFKELATDPEFASEMSPGMIKVWAGHLPVEDSHHACSIAGLKSLKAANVMILAGTDLGYPYPPMMHIELEIFVKDAGFTPVEALKTATSNAVDGYKVTDRGRIAPGLRADLLLVKGDPTTDITALRHIDGVWVNGVGIDREAFKARAKAFPDMVLTNPQPDPNRSRLVPPFDPCASMEPAAAAKP